MESHGVPRDEAGHAAELIEQLCLARGWNAYDLAAATAVVGKRRRDPSRYEVSRRTISRVLSAQTIPSARVKCGIALALDVAPWQLWGKGAMPLLHEQAQSMQVAA